MGDDRGKAIAGRYEALLCAHLRGLWQAREPERVEVTGLRIECVDHEFFALVTADRAAHMGMVRDGVRGVCQSTVEGYATPHIHELIVDLDVTLAQQNLDRRGRRVHDVGEGHRFAHRVRVVQQRVVSVEHVSTRRGETGILGHLRGVQQPNAV